MSQHFELKELSFSGCYEILPKYFLDRRGYFIKTLQESSFQKLGIDFEVREEFISISKLGAIRGIHFQEPPYGLKKIVYCPRGKTFEVLVDLRKNSPTFKKSISLTLDEKKMNMLFIPEGIGHGFQALADDTMMIYKTSSEYREQADRGILWNSLGIEWPLLTSLISERDQCFSSLANYQSPFFYRDRKLSQSGIREVEI